MSAENATTSQPKATDVCKNVPLDRPIRKLLSEEMSAVEFVKLLEKEAHFNEAVRVVAAMLPVRERVWWACQCARQSLPAEATAEVDIALQTAERWVTEMTEEARLSAHATALALEPTTAASLAAMAAFTSSGNISPPEAPHPITAPPEVSAQYVAGSVLVSALLPDPRDAPGRFRTFLQQGIELHNSLNAQ